MNEIEVLVVEDLNLAQKVAGDIFKRLHCRVIIAANACHALELAVTQHFDIIFIDIMLPDINGFEIASTIRSKEKQGSHIPLIAVTANSSEELAAESKVHGFDDYILKPMSIEAIRYVLHKNLIKFKKIA